MNEKFLHRSSIRQFFLVDVLIESSPVHVLGYLLFLKKIKMLSFEQVPDISSFKKINEGRKKHYLTVILAATFIPQQPFPEVVAKMTQKYELIELILLLGMIGRVFFPLVSELIKRMPCYSYSSLKDKSLFCQVLFQG